MKRFILACLGIFCGYVLGAVAGYAFVSRASSNGHDRPVEAAMTGAFATGPLGAIVGGAVGLILGRRGRRG